jgi:Fis family transcriptional regulator, factor for inversion stimulation protein
MSNTSQQPLREHVQQTLENYFNHLDGEAPRNLYQTVLGEVEQPLLEFILQHTEGNQSQAADILGINRNTLRKKIRHYSLSHLTNREN